MDGPEGSGVLANFSRISNPHEEMWNPTVATVLIRGFESALLNLLQAEEFNRHS
jgi:hypothetical protein